MEPGRYNAACPAGARVLAQKLKEPELPAGGEGKDGRADGSGEILSAGQLASELWRTVHLPSQPDFTANFY